MKKEVFSLEFIRSPYCDTARRIKEEMIHEVINQNLLTL